MKLPTSVRNSFDRWLKRLAEANQRQFGSEPPDCCKINRVRPKHTVHTRQ